MAKPNSTAIALSELLRLVKEVQENQKQLQQSQKKTREDIQLLHTTLESLQSGYKDLLNLMATSFPQDSTFYSTNEAIADAVEQGKNRLLFHTRTLKLIFKYSSKRRSCCPYWQP